MGARESLLLQLSKGDNLPELTRTIVQEDIDSYAEASGDFNPIHIDQEFARKTPLGGTVAHGMLVLAYVVQMVEGVFGSHWGTNSSLNVRFKNPARPGDTLTIGGKVRNVTNSKDGCEYTCEVRCTNQNGEIIISGEIISRVILTNKVS